MGALILLSMHSSVRHAAARAIPVIAALMGSIALSPAAHTQGLSWRADQNFAVVPMLIMMALLNGAVNVLLQRQQSTAAREALLARTGLRLVNVTDPNEVRRVAGAALRTLGEEWPDLPTLVVRREGDRAEVEVATGVHRGVEGDAVPLRAVDGLSTSLTPLDGAQHAALGAVVDGVRSWHGMAFGDDGDDRSILIAGRSIPVAMSDGLRAIATYWSLAETNCRVHAELGHRADSDQLTALHNRRWFLQRLAAARSVPDGTSCDALLMIDLDDFKQINDVYGHAAGDGVLVAIADRITRAAGSTGWPARLGGDEFAVLLTGLQNPAAAQQAAERLREDLLQPVRLSEATVRVGASIGIAIATADLTAGDLLRCADIAMYSAKAKGKNRVERFTPDRYGSIEHLRRMEEHLAHALDRDEISVHYQPRVDIATGRCLGMEAMARWHDQVLGPIAPATFIPLAVRTGQIKELGAHVLRSACEQLAIWRREAGWRDLTMSVNVSAPQLYDATVADVVRQTLRDTGVPVDRLILDLVGEPVIDLNRAIGTLTALADLGVRIALDDFGEGSMSIAALRTLPVQQIKIDQSLTTGRHPADQAMVQIIVATAGTMGIETVAECVETYEQSAAMREAGVTAAQGFLFAPPMPAEDATAWLARQPLDPDGSPFSAARFAAETPDAL
jgi:diguanylate cyclase (GGDEF)-like protein